MKLKNIFPMAIMLCSVLPVNASEIQEITMFDKFEDVKIDNCTKEITLKDEIKSLLINENINQDISLTDGINSLESIENIDITNGLYTITIPKNITIGQEKQANYNVKVSGMIGNNQQVYVNAIDEISETQDIDFYLTEQQTQEKVVANVIHSKNIWNSSDVSNEVVSNNEIKALSLKGGVWQGYLQFDIGCNELTLSENSINLGVGKNKQINAFFNGINVNNSVEWSSNNSKITVNNGLITVNANASGGDSATITIKKDELIQTMKVNIYDINVNTSSIEIKQGANATVTASVLPSSLNGTVNWNATLPSGVTLSKNGNYCTIQVSSSATVGTFTLTASYGGLNKNITVKVVKKDDYVYPDNPIQAEVEKELRTNGLITFTEGVQQAWDAGLYEEWGWSYEEVMADAPTFGAGYFIGYATANGDATPIVSTYKAYGHTEYYLEYMGKQVDGTYKFKCYYG